MKRKEVVLLVIVAVLLVTAGLFIVNKPSKPLTDTTTPVQSETVQTTTQKPITPPTPSELLKLTNAERAKVGVKPLKLDERLNKSAQWKADDMDTRNYYAHEDPVTGSRNGLDKINQLIKCYRVSENIAHRDRTATANDAIGEWVKSQSHYKAMIDSKYDYIGFGSNKYYVVQHFCEL